MGSPYRHLLRCIREESAWLVLKVTRGQGGIECKILVHPEHERTEFAEPAARRRHQ
ncbi:MAG: hypothetical protein ACYCXT_11845 [Acidiferrobacteraceae bacterium]